MTKTIGCSAVDSRNGTRQELFRDTLEEIREFRYKGAYTKLQDGQVNSEVQGFFKDIEQEVLILAKALIDLMHEIRAKDRDNRTKENGHEYARSYHILIEDGQEKPGVLSR